MTAESASDRIVLQFSTSADTLANWASAVIRRLNHSPFSHVDFVLPDGNMLGASDQGDKSPLIEGNRRGVAIRPPEYQEFGYRRRMILQTDKASAIIAAAKSQLGKPFDGEALHDFVSDAFPGVRDWRDNGSWFCAEHTVWSLETGGYWLPDELSWPKNRVSPTDLFLIFQFDHNWINRATFWDPVPGLKLGVRER